MGPDFRGELGIPLRSLIKELKRQKDIPNSPLFRLSMLPRSIANGINQHKRDMIVLGGLTILLAIGATASVLEATGQSRMNNAIPAAADIFIPEPQVSGPDPFPFRSTIDVVSRYMQADVRTAKPDGSWEGISISPVQITVNKPDKTNEPSGINVRDFPDVKLGQRVQTGKNEPFYKILPGGDWVVAQDFVVRKHQNGKISIWAILSGEKPEFFAVLYEDKWLAKFTTDSDAIAGDGRTTPGEKLFGLPLSQPASAIPESK